MEVHVKLDKPVFSKAMPMSCMLANTADELIVANKQLEDIFNGSSILVNNYKSVQALWIRILAVMQSRCGNYLVALVDDNQLLVFDTLHNNVTSLYVPIIEEMLLCGVCISGSTVIIGGNLAVCIQKM